jgi:hypothetical protein
MIDRAENLLPRLLPAGVEHHDLVSVVSSRFGGSLYEPDRRATFFPMNPPHALRLEYNQDLELTGAFAEEALSEEDVEAVPAELKRNFLESAGPGVGQGILFGSAPVDGWWGYRDRFRIIRVPPEASRPHVLVAPHPFLVEFIYNRSPEFTVSLCRRRREEHRLALLLSSLLKSSITWHLYKAVGGRHSTWVQLPNSGSVWNIAFCQIAYEHESIPHVLDAFTPTDGFGRLPLVPAERYYQPRYIRDGDSLELPSDLEESIDLFFALPAQQQDRFLQASYWLNQANRVDSFSAMFMYIIQAIESLAWRRRSQTYCPRCNKPEGPGPTRLFNEFLDRHAPEATEGRRLLYNVRSGLSHGSMPPFLVDTEMYFGFVPEEQWQRQLVEEALEAARHSMHNWLRNPCAGDVDVT